jgi:hypothetical protein
MPRAASKPRWWAVLRAIRRTSSGHHGVLGAAAGSVIGRHEANKRAKLQRQDRPTQSSLFFDIFLNSTKTNFSRFRRALSLISTVGFAIFTICADVSVKEALGAGGMFAHPIAPGDDAAALSRKVLREKFGQHHSFDQPINYPRRSITRARSHNRRAVSAFGKTGH